MSHGHEQMITPRHVSTAAELLTLLGGRENIVDLAHCVTRLRISLADRNRVDGPRLGQHPAVLGILERDTFQVVVGPAAVAALAAAMADQLDPREASGTTASSLTVLAPLTGVTESMSDLPDPVFSNGLVGPGRAILPDLQPQIVCAPIAGQLHQLKPHSFIVLGEGGRAVLVHLGIDTVRAGRSALLVQRIAQEGQLVAGGDPIVLWHPDEVVAAGFSPACPVVALDAPLTALFQTARGRISSGAPLFVWDHP